MVKAGFDDLRAALANFGELAAVVRPLPCLPAMLHATQPKVFDLEACVPVAELLEKQRPSPGHGGLNVSVAREMARIEDRMRGWAEEGQAQAEPRDSGATRRAKKELSPHNCAGRPDPGSTAAGEEPHGGGGPPARANGGLPTRAHNASREMLRHCGGPGGGARGGAGRKACVRAGQE